eukprot:6179717-Pleurochrysis_carterae.AAC.7
MRIDDSATACSILNCQKVRKSDNTKGASLKCEMASSAHYPAVWRALGGAARCQNGSCGPPLSASDARSI